MDIIFIWVFFSICKWPQKHKDFLFNFSYFHPFNKYIKKIGQVHSNDLCVMLSTHIYAFNCSICILFLFQLFYVFRLCSFLYLWSVEMNKTLILLCYNQCGTRSLLWNQPCLNVISFKTILRHLITSFDFTSNMSSVSAKGCPKTHL